MPSALTAVGTITIKHRSVFGNKRWVVFEVAIGDVGADTWPSGGLTILPAQVGLRAFDYCEINPGVTTYTTPASTLSYTLSSTGVLQAYTAAASVTSAAVKLIVATGSAPYEVIRIMAIGYGVDTA